MGNLTYDSIVNYKTTIDNNRNNLDIILRNYKSNVGTIDSNINGIKFEQWQDDVSDMFSDYKDYLANGVVSKLNSSIGTNGSLRKLKELIDSLYNQCSKYISNFESVKTKYGDLKFGNDNKLFYVSGDINDEELLTNLNRDFSSQRDIINSTLTELQSLRFDTIVDFSGSYASLPDINDYQVKTKPVEPVIISQFDVVKVYIEDKGYVNMYYLGTDDQGRSYFSESVDDKAKAYRAVIPGMGSTAQSWVTDVSTLTMPGGADAAFAFVIFGGNTGDMTVGNVLKKIGKSYANGYYTGNAHFNETIIFEDPNIAPEVVSRASHEVDEGKIYYAVDRENLNAVPLKEVLANGFDTDEHPNIVLAPGEKITTSYHRFLWVSDHYTIGYDDKPVTLVWNEYRKAYFVLKENGYSSYDENEGIYYVTLDKLKDKKTKFVTK